MTLNKGKVCVLSVKPTLAKASGPFLSFSLSSIRIYPHNSGQQRVYTVPVSLSMHIAYWLCWPGHWPPPTPLCCSTGRESRWSPLRAGHQAAQQPICIQRLLQRAALRAGLAAERSLPCAGFQELGAERRLRQRGRGRIPRASRQAAKGMSRRWFWLLIWWEQCAVSRRERASAHYCRDGTNLSLPAVCMSDLSFFLLLW